MNKIFFYLLFLLLLFASCSEDKSGLKDADYSSLYDEFIMQHSSLESLSSLSGASNESLVRMRYGMIDEDSDVTETLRSIIIASRSNDSDKLNSIKKNSKKFISDNRTVETTKSHYDSINRERNQLFGEELPEIISNFVSEKVDSYIESKYTLFSALPNTWNYYTKSEEEFANDFLKDLNTSNLGTECESYYIQRVNDYKNAVCEESKIVGDNVTIPDFTVIPGGPGVEINDDIKKLITERTKSQIGEISSGIFWDIIALLIVNIIIDILIDKAVGDAGVRAVQRFLDNASIKKGDGLLKNATKTFLIGVGIHGEYKDEVDSIKSKYGLWKKIVKFIVLIMSVIITYYVIIKPQLKIEGKMNTELTSKIIESSNTFNLNPEGIINRYLNIEDLDDKGLETPDVEPMEVDASGDLPEGVIPDWIPESISQYFISPDFFYSGSTGGIELSTTYNGVVNQYPIIMKLKLNEDGIIDGKYAYNSTLRKYGDSDSSWFKIEGAVLINNEDNTSRLVLRSIHPDTGKTFEYFVMAPDINGFEGNMVNIIHLDDIRSNLYDVQLIPE